MPMRISKGIRVALVGLVAASAVVATKAPGAQAAESVRSSRSDARLPVALNRLNPTPLPTIGQPAPEKEPDAPVTLNVLHRDSFGLVSLTWTMAYNGDTPDYLIGPNLVSVYRYAGASASAVSLTDEVGKIRYNPLRMDPSGTCICTDNPSIPNDLNKGQSAVFYETYKLPATVHSVTVSIPGYSPAQNVPVN